MEGLGSQEGSRLGAHRRAEPALVITGEPPKVWPTVTRGDGRVGVHRTVPLALLEPKANDYSYAVIGPWPHLSLGSMEPGGPSWTVIAFGLLLVLLAELFRHGADLAEEQKLTV